MPLIWQPFSICHPHVTEINMVRLTPFMSETINHMKQFVDDKTYSVIGGGYYADPECDSEIEQAKQGLIERTRIVFPRLDKAQLVEVYVSQKTEVIASGAERN